MSNIVENKKDEVKDDVPIVLVTGANGFIAKRIIHDLLIAGKYKIRGTVRNVEKWTKKLDELYKNIDKKYELELKYGDLTDEKGWDDALKDVTYVLHTASPFPLELPKDPNDLVKPAVSGVEMVFNAAVRAGTVKRIVQTSSVAAVYVGQQDKMINGVGNFDETSWSNDEKCDAYSLSKVRAEQKFWELAKANPQIECVAINPSLVVGPLLDDTYNTSQEPICILLKREFPFVPNTYFNFVDVRDVSQAHIRAIDAPKDVVNGERFVTATSTLSFQQFSQVLYDEYHDKGYNPPLKEAPWFILKVVSICDERVRNHVLPNLGFKFELNNDKLHKALDIDFISAKDGIIAMANDLIKMKKV